MHVARDEVRHPGDRRRLLLVGTRRLYLEALCELLDTTEGLSASVASPAEGATSCSGDPTEIVLLDCQGSREGLAGLVTNLAEAHPGARIVLLTSGTPRESTEQVDSLHASGWVSLNGPVSELVHALDDRGAPSAGGRTRSPRSHRSSSGAEWPLSSLTEREMSVLQLVVDGRSPEEIADRLCISRHTVRTHLQNIMSKLLVRSQTEMVSLARNAGVRARHLEAGL